MLTYPDILPRSTLSDMSVKPKSQPLTPYLHKGYSQYGEEGIIDHVLSKIHHDKLVVDIGASDGITFSNVYSLILKGYKAHLFELDVKKCEKMKILFALNAKTIIHNEFIDPIVKPLHLLLNSFLGKDKISVLSIDIDSQDALVFDSLGDTRPLLIVIEFNGNIANHMSIMQTEYGRTTGNSALALCNIARSKGYVLIHATWGNLIFLEKTQISKCQLLEIQLDEALDDSGTVKGIFTGFDGKVYFSGGEILDFPWHAYNVNLKKILSKREPFGVFKKFTGDFNKIEKIVWSFVRYFYVMNKKEKLEKKIKNIFINKKN
jgi:hypothetical protein